MAHLHCDSVPDTLAILDALLAHRAFPPGGWTPDEWGAEVDWDELATSYLSTSERAAVQIARGCASAEAHGGGLPVQVRQAVQTAIDHLTDNMKSYDDR